MSQAPQSLSPREPTAEQVDVVEDETEIQAVLDALDDSDCRAILEATSDEELTAGEVSETCDLPLSTAYRKVDVLTEAGLLEERTRIRSSGSHTSEYARIVEDVHVSMGDGELVLEISKRSSQTPTPRGLVAANSD